MDFKPGPKLKNEKPRDEMGRKYEWPDRMSRKRRIGTGMVAGQWNGGERERERDRGTDTINEGKIVLAPNERSVGAIVKAA